MQCHTIFSWIQISLHTKIQPYRLSRNAIGHNLYIRPLTTIMTALTKSYQPFLLAYWDVYMMVKIRLTPME
jgi:hypothetical protein